MDWENGPGTIFKPKTAKENKVKKPLPTRMIPKAVEEFLQEVKNDHPSLAGPERGGMDFAAKYLLTDPDSPVKQALDKAEDYRMHNRRHERDCSDCEDLGKHLAHALAALKEGG